MGQLLTATPLARLHNPAFGLSVEKYAVGITGSPILLGCRLRG